jgi:hypothetical protein
MALQGGLRTFGQELSLSHLVSSVLPEAAGFPSRGCILKDKDHLTQRIADLAAFLDPLAFERDQDQSLAKRRRAAWREASNRIMQQP